MRYKEIKSKISSHYKSLPKNQKVIAEFIIENFDKVPFLSVKDVSKEIDKSVASVVRFAQRVGFKGFLEMREEIGRSLQTQIEKKEIFTLADEKEFVNDTLAHVAKHDIENINDTLSLLDRKSFQSAIAQILKSDRIFTAGLGVSHILAEILAYQLTQIGVDARNFTHNSTNFLEQLIYLNKNDTLLVLSFPPYSEETIEAAKLAREKKIRVISLTDKSASPIMFHSDISLVVTSKNLLYTNSFAAISVVINAIATECARLNKTKAKKTLELLDKITESQKNIVTKELK